MSVEGTNNLRETVFYKIIQGEMPCHKVYEDDTFLVILDIFPANLGHCLILPKTPAQDIFELDDKTAAGLVPLAKRVAAAVMAATGSDGVNIIQNNGAASGQVIFYYHMHVVPRYHDDKVQISHGSPKHSHDEFADMAVKVQGRL